MHATIHRYQGTGDRTEELARAVCQVASGLSRVRGFVSCVVLEAGPGILTTVSIFEDQSGIKEARGLFEASFAERHGHLLSGAPQVSSGEIVFQRGL